MVNLITPPPAVEKPKEPRQAAPVKPRIKRVEPQPEPPPLITAATEAPPPPAAPEPQPVAPTVAPAPVAAAPAATPPVPVVPPSFNAAYLNNPPPAYPAVARRAGEQGKVVLRVLVNASGSPDKVEIRSSSGFSRLDDAALDAVRRWRFVPARQGDKPVAAVGAGTDHLHSGKLKHGSNASGRIRPLSRADRHRGQGGCSSSCSLMSVTTWYLIITKSIQVADDAPPHRRVSSRSSGTRPRCRRSPRISRSIIPTSRSRISRGTGSSPRAITSATARTS